MVMMMMVGLRCERVPGLLEWEAHQRAVLQAENQLLAETVQTVPGIEQWEAQHRAALATQNNRQEEEEGQEEGSLESEQTTTETAETVARSTSTSATPTGLKSILELSFNRLLSKLKLRQNDNQEDGEENNNDNNDNNEEENLKVESGNSNYLDLLLNSYNLNDKGKQREIPRSFRKPSSSFDDKVLYDNEYYDYDGGEGDRRRFSNRFRFLYEDDSDISFAVKQSRQLDRSLRRFLSKLDKF